MDEYEPVCGSNGMGCLYCTTQCPNCGREVFDTDLVYGDTKTCCNYCDGEEDYPSDEELADDDFEDDLEELDDDYDDLEDDMDELDDDF